MPDCELMRRPDMERPYPRSREKLSNLHWHSHHVPIDAVRSEVMVERKVWFGHWCCPLPARLVAARYFFPRAQAITPVEIPFPSVMGTEWFVSAVVCRPHGQQSCIPRKFKAQHFPRLNV